MYLIASFGLLMSALSILMIADPENWSQGIVSFSTKFYFHLFEIFSRMFFGLGFIYYSDQSLFPNIILTIGYILITVSVGLAFTPPSKHKKFAVWSANKFKKQFRYFGIISFLFGLFIIYTVWFFE